MLQTKKHPGREPASSKPMTKANKRALLSAGLPLLRSAWVGKKAQGSAGVSRTSACMAVTREAAGAEGAEGGRPKHGSSCSTKGPPRPCQSPAAAGREVAQSRAVLTEKKPVPSEAVIWLRTAGMDKASETGTVPRKPAHPCLLCPAACPVPRGETPGQHPALPEHGGHRATGPLPAPRDHPAPLSPEGALLAWLRVAGLRRATRDRPPPAPSPLVSGRHLSKDTLRCEASWSGWCSQQGLCSASCPGWPWAPLRLTGVGSILPPAEPPITPTRDPQQWQPPRAHAQRKDLKIAGSGVRASSARCCSRHEISAGLKPSRLSPGSWLAREGSCDTTAPSSGAHARLLWPALHRQRRD